MILDAHLLRDFHSGQLVNCHTHADVMPSSFPRTIHHTLAPLLSICIASEFFHGGDFDVCNIVSLIIYPLFIHFFYLILRKSDNVACQSRNQEGLYTREARLPQFNEIV